MINFDTFSSCGLNSVVIPDSVTEIGADAFSWCHNLISITCKATTPPTIDNPFDNGNNYPIYVPATSVNTYKAASGWSKYASRIQAISE